MPRSCQTTKSNQSSDALGKSVAYNKSASPKYNPSASGSSVCVTGSGSIWAGMETCTHSRRLVTGTPEGLGQLHDPRGRRKDVGAAGREPGAQLELQTSSIKAAASAAPKLASAGCILRHYRMAVPEKHWRVLADSYSVHMQLVWRH